LTVAAKIEIAELARMPGVYSRPSRRPLMSKDRLPEKTQNQQPNKEFEGVERAAILIADIIERINRSLDDDGCDSQLKTNGKKKSKNSKQGKRRRGTAKVMIFTVAAVSLILILVTAAMYVYGPSAKTAIPFAALVIIFAFVAWLVLRGRP
jgi:hypothetical protein